MYLGGHMTEVCCIQEIHEKGKITWLLQCSEGGHQKEYFKRFPGTHFLSLSGSPWMASHASGVSTSPLNLVSSANLLEVHLFTPSMPLRHWTAMVSIQTSESYHLSLMSIRTLSRLLCSSGCDRPTTFINLMVLSWNLSLQFREKDLLGGLCQRLYAISDTSVALPLYPNVVTPSKKPTSLVKQDFLLLKLCWLSPVSSLSSMCLNASPRRISSMIFPGRDVRLTSRKFPGFSFLPFLIMGTVIPLFQSPGSSSDCKFSDIMESGYSNLQTSSQLDL